MVEQSPFELSVDMAAHKLTATLRGLWTTDTVRRYGSELGAAARQVATDDSPAKWLIDLRALEVQPQEVAAAMSGIIATLNRRFDALVAIVTPRVLVTLQSRRVAQATNYRNFANLDDAEAWLDRH